MERIQYQDFELRITGQAGQYTAQVYHSPAGEADARFSIPLSADRLDLLLLRLTRLRGTSRGMDTVEQDAARELGGALFQAVFQGRVRDVLRSSLEKRSQDPDAGLRIKLRLQDAPELADLPWEFLYDADLDRFLSKSNRTPVVRYIELPESILPLRAKRPLRILGIVSAPSDFPHLDVAREQQVVEKSLEALIQAGSVTIDWLEDATLPALRRKLQGGEYHILHFIGHGSFDKQTEQGVLLFEDTQSRSARVDADRLGVLLHDHRSLRLAVLNACEGARSTRTDPFAGVATTLARQGLPAVVAMQFAISDEAAVTFASEFYTALAGGFPVDAAVAEARKAIYTDLSDVEWATPVLFLRAADGVLFEMKEEETGDSQAGPTRSKGVTQVYINTSGGAYFEGPVTTGGGDVIGQDKVEKKDELPVHQAPSADKEKPKSPVEPAAEMPTRTKPDSRQPSSVSPVRQGFKDWAGKNRRILLAAAGILGALLLLWGVYSLFLNPPNGSGKISLAATLTPTRTAPPTQTSTAMRTATMREPTRAPSLTPSILPSRTLTPRPSPTPANTDPPRPPPEIGSTLVSPKDGMVMMYVPAGAFLMGSTNNDRAALDHEKPIHKVELEAFWIDRTEVSNAQYARCVETGPCMVPSDNSSWAHENYYNDPEYSDYPVIYVTWEDANTYCAWAERRLPSEAEWEKAARGTSGWTYPWGNQDPSCSLANTVKDPEKNLCVSDTNPVESYPAGASMYKVLNMAGNVWEWVNDWYDEDYYAVSPASNPRGPKGGTAKVMRGGSWGDPWTSLRAANRNNRAPTGSYLGVGFRCATSPEK